MRWCSACARVSAALRVAALRAPFISFHFISFHFISFHFISFHFISFHFISFHFISFHFISFHFISFHFISFHFISFSVTQHARHAHAQVTRETHHFRCTQATFSQVCETVFPCSSCARSSPFGAWGMSALVGGQPRELLDIARGGGECETPSFSGFSGTLVVMARGVVLYVREWRTSS